MTKEKAYIGIDPGVTGALAIIIQKEIYIHDFKDASESNRVLMAYHDSYNLLAYIEKIHAMPKGSIGNFKKGENFGIWQGLLAANGIPHLFVTSQRWQKTYLKNSSELTTKKRSLDVARRLYPHIAQKYLKRQKDHNRADALLIATYAKNYGLYA